LSSLSMILLELVDDIFKEMVELKAMVLFEPELFLVFLGIHRF